MDSRYQDTHVADLWSPQSQYRFWLAIEQAVASAQAHHQIIPPEAAQQINQIPLDAVDGTTLAKIGAYELRTRHDVAAFLRWLRQEVGEEHGRWVHHGLTSSDVVDTALALRFRSLSLFVSTATATLRAEINALCRKHALTPVLGFTHGQPAEPTTLGLRAAQWREMVTRARVRVLRDMVPLQVAKTSGPVGTYAHNPPEVERMTAELLGLRPAGVGISQVVPRDLLAAWAQSAAGMVAVCGKIAIDFRLMAARGEVTEGWPADRVGSSAMPHKRNPVTAEQINGMVRLAAGYAAMLTPVDLWDERDMSHSCVERVAVPDLLHALFHAVWETAELLHQADWRTNESRRILDAAGKTPYTAWRTLREVEAGQSRNSAAAGAMAWAANPGISVIAPDPLDMVRNHPEVATAWPAKTDKEEKA